MARRSQLEEILTESEAYVALSGEGGDKGLNVQILCV